jgi:hypothetical protein
VLLPGGSAVVPHDLSARVLADQGRGAVRLNFAESMAALHAEVSQGQRQLTQALARLDAGSPQSAPPMEINQTFEVTVTGGQSDGDAILAKLRPAMQDEARAVFDRIERARRR